MGRCRGSGGRKPPTFESGENVREAVGLTALPEKDEFPVSVKALFSDDVLRFGACLKLDGKL
jgi:hypothetical protein